MALNNQEHFLVFIDAADDAGMFPVSKLQSVTCAGDATVLVKFAPGSLGDGQAASVDVVTLTVTADTEKTVIAAYGCWGLKKFMGREYEGIHRKTFVIQNNKILKIFEKVKTNDRYATIQ